MRSALTAITLGIALVAGVLYGRVSGRRSHEKDVRDVALLRSRLEGVRRELGGAATAADSARLAALIREEEEGINFREYHVLRRQATPDTFWSPTGLGTLSTALGSALVLGGVAVVLRRRGRLTQGARGW